MDFNPDLLLKLLESDLSVHTGLDINNVRSLALLESVFKKWIPKETSCLETIALDGFYAANEKCSTFNFEGSSEEILDIVARTKQYLYNYFYSHSFQTSQFCLTRILSEGATGPGSSCLADRTNFYHKMFDGRLSTTSTLLYFHYKTNISPRWAQAELIRSARYQVDVVEASNLSTVPKNARTNRTICTEPSLNMFYQLGAGSYLSRLCQRYHNIDMSTQQEVNKGMAWAGSYYGNFATIDLKSASDTISKALVYALFPPTVCNVLREIRCTHTQYKGVKHELHMISSMGNGFTFPLQTLIFATLVRSTYDYLGIIPNVRTSRNYSVFGDDIICLSKAYDTLCRVLTACGFIVNSEKSYNEGPFRESCGADYFKGLDIRGVYLKEIRDEQDIYSTFNRLSRWSAKHNININSALQYVKGLAKFQPVPFDAGDGEGFKCPSSFLRNTKTDFNGCRSYKASFPRKRELKFSESDLGINYHGALIGAVGGYVRGNSVNERCTVVRYKVVKRKTPRWDYVPDAGVTIRDYEAVWETLL